MERAVSGHRQFYPSLTFIPGLEMRTAFGARQRPLLLSNPKAAPDSAWIVPGSGVSLPYGPEPPACAAFALCFPSR